MFQDILAKMVCDEPTRDCHMGICLHCKEFADTLKDRVHNVFNDLEIDEVRFLSL